MKKIEVRCYFSLYERDDPKSPILNKEHKIWIGNFNIKDLEQLMERFININNHDYGEYWKRQIVNWTISIQVNEYDEFNRLITHNTETKIPYATWYCDFLTKDWIRSFKDSLPNVEKYYNFIQDLIKE